MPNRQERQKEMEKKTTAKPKKNKKRNIDKMQTRINDQTKTDSFTLTQEHIDFLRQTRVVWDPSEAGAPIIDPEAVADAGLRHIPTALQVVLKHGHIEPGTYVISNQLRERYEFDQLRADAEGHMIAIPKDDQIVFELRPQHIKLLHNANANAFLYFGATGFNSKHPYGQMTYWEIDAAHILGMLVYRDQNGLPNFTEEELDLLHRFHLDMLFALPAFLANAKVEPGEYTRKSGSTGAWERNS
jgi:hypothetical protein